jgi:hypothetical protein
MINICVLDEKYIACLGSLGVTIGGLGGGSLKLAMGGKGIGGVPTVQGRPEASGAGVGAFVFTGGFKFKRLRSFVLGLVIGLAEGQVIETMVGEGFPIVACAVVGAIGGIALGVLKRHW